MFLFGGVGERGVLHDCWFFDLASGEWSELAGATGGDRDAASRLASHRGLLEFPGGRSGQPVLLAPPLGLLRLGYNMQLESFDFGAARWRMVPVAGATVAPTAAQQQQQHQQQEKPLARYGGAVAYDAERSSLWVFGGRAGPGALGDLWELRLVNVSAVETDSCHGCRDTSEAAGGTGDGGDGGGNVTEPGGACGAGGAAQGYFARYYGELCRAVVG